MYESSLILRLGTYGLPLGLTYGLPVGLTGELKLPTPPSLSAPVCLEAISMANNVPRDNESSSGPGIALTTSAKSSCWGTSDSFDSVLSYIGSSVGEGEGT